MKKNSIHESSVQLSKLDSQNKDDLPEEVSTSGSDIHRVNPQTVNANKQLAMSTKALLQLENETYDK